MVTILSLVCLYSRRIYNFDFAFLLDLKLVDLSQDEGGVLRFLRLPSSNVLCYESCVVKI